MPPQKKRRSEASASGRLWPRSSSCCRNGVAPPLTVQRLRSIRPIASLGDQTSTKRLAEPRTHGMSKAQKAPVMWVTGEGMKTTSSGPMAQASPIPRTR